MLTRVICVLSACLMTACSRPTHQVTYKVMGPDGWPTIEGIGASAQIAITNDEGGIETHNVNLPYVQQLEVPAGSFVSVNAQVERGDEIRCEIYVDGRLVRQSHGDGDFSIADCSGSV